VPPATTRIVHAVTPVQTEPVAPSGVASVSTPVDESAPRPHRSEPRPHVAVHRPSVVHRVRVVHRAPAQIVRFSFPFGWLATDLLILPRAAIRAGAQTQRDGVLLLLSSVAMAGLAVASVTMFRRLRRLVAS
jgi:hypothetical protein